MGDENQGKKISPLSSDGRSEKTGLIIRACVVVCRIGADRTYMIRKNYTI